MVESETRVMTVLPLKEGFSSEQVGAIGLLVHRLAQKGDWIVGRPLSHSPFSGRSYLTVSKPLIWPINETKRYIYGIVRLIRHYHPVLVEIHNRPEIAVSLSKYFPTLPISLFLHNDPLHMRKAQTIQQRQWLIQRSHVVAVSEWVKARFLKGGIQGEVTVLSNCIDCQAIPPFIPISQREKRILFVGRVVADKGADLFVQACNTVLKDYTDWQAEIIGADRFFSDSPETSFTRNLYSQIKDERITFRGYLPHKEVLNLMSKSAIVVVPSRWSEPFGMTALEAMACGTPLIVSARGALPSLVGKAALLIDPEKENGLSQSLQQLIKDENLRDSLSRQGMKRAQFYDLPQAKHKLEQFRQQICPILETIASEKTVFSG